MADITATRRPWLSVAFSAGFLLIVFVVAGLLVAGAAAAPATGPGYGMQVDPEHTGTPCPPGMNCYPGTRTPFAEGTHTPRPTCAPGMNCEPATRTPHVEATRTPHATCVPGMNCEPGTRTPEPCPPSQNCGTRTAEPHPTYTPRATCVPGMNCEPATRTPNPCGNHPCGTRTVNPEVTRTPHATCEPNTNCQPPTRTPHAEATRTPHATCVPGMNCEPGTRTPHPEMTRTPHPEGTRTPHATCVPGSNCLPATRTPEPCPPSHNCGTRTATPTGHAGALRLRPRVQFGQGAPGSTTDYDLMLLNRFNEPTLVDLEGHSVRGWGVDVNPSDLIVEPNESDLLTVEVDVPASPGGPVDLERVVANAEGVRPAYAFMITMLQRRAINDLPAGHWADGPVQYLLAEGIVSGYSDGTFRPDANVTRAQFAKMLSGAMDWQTQAPTRPSFSDVQAGHWAYGYIEAAVAHGVLSGYPDGTFRPDANVTRAQVAKMIAIARGWTMESPAEQSFIDVGATNWARDFAAMVSAADVMSGYTDGTFRPNAPATRAQIAKILTLGIFSDPND